MEVPAAYTQIGQANGVPPEVLYALASTESVLQLEHARRPWPWTLNVAGEGLRFENRDAACRALEQALTETKIVDVGIAQLNVRWQPQLFGPGERFADPCDGLDPRANLEEAAGILRQHYNNTGDWVAAAGRYHRPAGGAPAARYRRIMASELGRLGDGEVSAAPGMVASVADQAPSGNQVGQARGGDTAPLEDTSLTWVTPESRKITWVTPAPAHWVAAVATQEG